MELMFPQQQEVLFPVDPRPARELPPAMVRRKKRFRAARVPGHHTENGQRHPLPGRHTPW